MVDDVNETTEPPMDKIRGARLETVAQFLVLLARENVPPHIQEVLCHGDSLLGVRPGALERALAALPSCRGWRPVSDAPKDGTEIIGAFFDIRWADSHRKHDVVRCWWQPEFNAFISSCREMTLAPGLTFEDGTRRNLHSPVIEPITHWMPLPSPPER